MVLTFSPILPIIIPREASTLHDVYLHGIHNFSLISLIDFENARAGEEAFLFPRCAGFGAG
jgi:hypothetical protein